MARNRVRKIDNLFWTLGTATQGALTAGTAGSLVITSGTVPATLMRTRGHLAAWLDGTSAPGLGVQVSCGLIVRPEGTGGTVLQSPFTDGNADWFWFSSFFLGYEEMVTDVVDIPLISGYREVVDSKAMRRLKPDQEVQFVVENTTVLSASGININGSFRFLLGT